MCTQYVHDMAHAKFTGIVLCYVYCRPQDNVCAFRSATRDSIFVYPLQQPLSDRDSNKLRLESIRSALGWASLRYQGSDGVPGYD
jgi:hypothetical protein